MDDVQFMKENAIKQTYLFVADSKTRDKLAFPTPSEYVLNFDAPFHNVCGFDVIDASIPRTMYNVDTYNNGINFFIHTSNFDLTNVTLSNFTSVSILTGDYTIDTLLPVLNSSLTMPLNNISTNSNVSITVSATSTPPDVKSTLTFTCPYPFFLDMGNSSMNETLGFDEYFQNSMNNVTVLERNYVTPYYFYSNPSNLNSTTVLNNVWSTAYLELIKSISTTTVYSELIKLGASSNTATTAINNLIPICNDYQLFHSVDITDPTIATGNVLTIFSGPRGVIVSHTLSSGNFAQKFTVSVKGYLSQIGVAIATYPSGSSIPTGSEVSFNICADSNGLPNISNVLYSGIIGVSSTDGSFSLSDTFTSVINPGVYWLIISGSSFGVYYNDVISQTSSTLYYYNGTSWISYDNSNGLYYNMSAIIYQTYEYHTIVAPNLYTLVGDRYIVLRCPEIESHSFRSLSYSSHSLGLAKFKLGVIGYSENRNDFTSVPSREFHPIGKLSKIRLRFERSTGELYNFRGVNHTITFAVRYYEAIQGKTFTKSILNPNYNPDIMQYKIDQGASDEESDEQEYDYNRDQALLDTFKQVEQRAADQRMWALERLDPIETGYRSNR